MENGNKPVSKTAMQILIEWMEGQYYPAMYEDAIDKVQALKAKEEREQIEKAVNYSERHRWENKKPITGKQYYIQTYGD